MILTNKEAENLKFLISEIRSRIRSPRLRHNTIENLCDKASVILKKAGRKPRVTKLHFELGDFD